jgi:hypothetical protein
MHQSADDLDQVNGIVGDSLLHSVEYGVDWCKGGDGASQEDNLFIIPHLSMQLEFGGRRVILLS